MKRIGAVLTSAALLTALTACGQQSDERVEGEPAEAVPTLAVESESD